MRWVVEVSSIGKTDVQKFVVEAESWQRALQAARAQRGEEGPMSGFSIELLEEGYRAVDPVARVRFVVKRAADDLPVTAPLAKDTKGVAPSPASIPPPSVGGRKSVPPRPSGSSKSVSPPPMVEPVVNVAAPPAPAPAPEKKSSSIPPAPTLPVGAPIPGLPSVKVLSSREQDPTPASPLTYREYSFAVAAGTSEDIAANVLKGQLRIVDAQIQSAKTGKLVNLAVFDAEFTGKPPGPPLATLTWKDWKGDPVVGFPRRGQAPKQVKPPSTAPPAPQPEPSVPPPPAVPPAPPSSGTARAGGRPTPQALRAMVAAAQIAAPTPGPAGANPFLPAASAAPPATPSFPTTAPLIPAASPIPPEPRPASVAPPPPAPAPTPSGIPAPMVAPVTTFSPSHPPPQNGFPAPAITDAPPQRRPSSPDGMVRTPSGRFVRGRTTGDELITALFESMHDLHFLRDALDGGQFCLALATEVLPARAAIIHFFDIEKREWVVACTRGKEASRLLTLRTPEGDELLREAARRRRAVVTSNGETATAQRYQTLGGSRSMIIAPIMQAGRALGALEIINPLDGMPFREDEGNAITYIAEQYAEYLGSRGIIVDTGRIQSAAAAR